MEVVFWALFTHCENLNWWLSPSTPQCPLKWIIMAPSAINTEIKTSSVGMVLRTGPGAGEPFVLVLLSS